MIPAEVVVDSDLSLLVDAVARDLEVASLVAHRVHRYAEPIAVLPEMCPLLAVYPTREAPLQVGTGPVYNHDWYLTIAWWEAAGVETETLGTGSEALAKRLLFTAQQLMARVKAWSLNAIPSTTSRYGALEGDVVYDKSDSLCWRVEIPVRCFGGN